jgi:hypothetical protein
MIEYVSFTLIASFLLYFSAYVAVVYFFVVERRKKRNERKENFFKVLIGGLKTDSIATMDDVVNIYKGVAGLSSEDLSYRYGLSKQLREFLVTIVSKNKKFVDSSLDDDVIRDWKQKISEFIKKNETTSPYADLPTAERNILSDISTFLEMNDPDSVKRKTLELAGMIQARNDDLNRIRNINRWAVPLSAIGLIFTIVFGVLAWIR